MNLWVSMEDAGAKSHQTKRRFSEVFGDAGAAHPVAERRASILTPYSAMKFEEQVRVLIDAKVPAFSFIYGIPPKEILDECRAKGIAIIGTATTPDEAIALQNGERRHDRRPQVSRRADIADRSSARPRTR